MKFLFIIVNALFVAKYSARIFPKGTIYITLAYIVIMVLALWKVMPWLTSNRKMSLGLSVFGVVAILTMIGMQAYIDPFSLQVDRWSALHYPIDNLLHGKYPYSAQTHLGGLRFTFSHMAGVTHSLLSIRKRRTKFLFLPYSLSIYYLQVFWI